MEFDGSTLNRDYGPRWQQSSLVAELAIAHMEIGNYDMAIQALEVVAQTRSLKAWAWAYIAMVYKAKGDLPQAISAFEMATEGAFDGQYVVYSS